MSRKTTIRPALIALLAAAALTPTAAVARTQPASAHHLAADPGPGEAASKTHKCGEIGLSIEARSADDKESACETAKKVAKEAIEGSAPGPARGLSGLTVQVDGQTWTCQDRQSDEDPDPHTLCANTSRDSEQVLLYS
ncbi:unnamed protein product [[Actinomadura] parvosata subsp. kistnae]|uniref:Subtilisin inhibitor domain-containing protein n=1 Tax=[Actinomadura] parvosata subsp. kistnae TaxID=1909395 RepID=A0A1V0A0R4_9ACTN|nr:hypothetical protein [Nonomuraea sp. ATCC 55076]AQZ63780.1 hypothetical protein BKM31_22025 [Nonomuraea sp. ATCC 55076]SPL89597.1 unnamed protein product [Actinomadura parvosata subsp. kistnae]